MAILQGSSYRLPIKIRDCVGNLVTSDMVVKGSFTFGTITKAYGEGSSEVVYDAENGTWVVVLTEEETRQLKSTVQWQARFLFNNGEVGGTQPVSEYIYDSIDKTNLSGGVEDVGE